MILSASPLLGVVASASLLLLSSVVLSLLLLLLLLLSLLTFCHQCFCFRCCLFLFIPDGSFLSRSASFFRVFFSTDFSILFSQPIWYPISSSSSSLVGDSSSISITVGVSVFLVTSKAIFAAVGYPCSFLSLLLPLRFRFLWLSSVFLASSWVSAEPSLLFFGWVGRWFWLVFLLRSLVSAVGFQFLPAGLVAALSFLTGLV